MSATAVPVPSAAEEARRWRALRRFGNPVLRGLASPWAYGADRIPPAGGFVLAANHFSAIDHPVLAALSPRPLYFLSKAELFELPLLGRALGWTGAFPVRRGTADRGALRRSVELAAAGRVVAIHLEGTRQRSGRPGRFKSGAITIAALADVPVVPCGLDTFGWSPLGRRTCVAVFGDPLQVGGAPREQALELVGAEVVRLWELARRARELGLPEELPGCGRRSRPVGS